MAKCVRIVLTMGASMGPLFNLYSDSDGFGSPFEWDIPWTHFGIPGHDNPGYITCLVPNDAKQIKVVPGTGSLCDTELTMDIAECTTTTTSTTGVPPSTTTSTTGVPPTTTTSTTLCFDIFWDVRGSIGGRLTITGTGASVDQLTDDEVHNGEITCGTGEYVITGRWNSGIGSVSKMRVCGSVSGELFYDGNISNTPGQETAVYTTAIMPAGQDYYVYFVTGGAEPISCGV